MLCFIVVFRCEFSINRLYHLYNRIGRGVVNRGGWGGALNQGNTEHTKNINLHRSGLLVSYYTYFLLVDQFSLNHYQVLVMLQNFPNFVLNVTQVNIYYLENAGNIKYIHHKHVRYILLDCIYDT